MFCSCQLFPPPLASSANGGFCVILTAEMTGKENLEPPAGKSDIAKKEEETLEFWRREKIFEQTLAKSAPRGKFVFYEGPPTANGRPGIHHLAARAFKDVIPRFRTMRGYHVRRKAGWDTHGLPVELEVEKDLGLKTKKEIENFGVAAFNQCCRENVWKYRREWERFTERIGFWLDQTNAYVTYQSEYLETVWWILKRVAERDLLYRGYKVLPWCPRCGTALSSHEVAQGYKEVEDPAVFVKFKVKNPTRHGLPDNTFLVAWTTTPWTLPGNVALAVGEKVEYALVEYNGENFIMAASAGEKMRSSVLLASGSARPSFSRLPTAQLLGLAYEPLFDFPQLQNEKSHRVYAADFVTTSEGTGIVHTAVMYGADDFVLGQKIGLPLAHLVAEDGTFVEGTPWAGQFVKKADRAIADDLQKRGLLFREEVCRHTYPFCWRCKTPLIYYARDSWYIKMTALKADLLAANETINWEPEHFKRGRFGEWLAEVKDWAISRERYWGTPLPFWLPVGEKSELTKPVVIGSLAELKKYTKKSGNRYLVMRHGEAENNVKDLLSSRPDNPHHLTERGREQVESTAKKLRAEKIDLIVSSDFVRARETAELVAKGLGLDKSKIMYDRRLGEVNHGDLNGQSVGVYHQFFKTPVEYFSNKLPNGESFADVKRRMGDCLYELEKQHIGKTILLVTHESPSWLLFAAAAGADIDESLKLRGDDDDFLKNAEARELDFIPLPHNADYEFDPHRPFIDELKLVDEAGRELRRVSEVLDVWFDSGAMPWAQDGYPASGREPLYPADYIAEAVDQTRGWFYTLLAIGVLLGRGSPYKNVVVLGHLLDKHGKKMSKSIGNVVDPWLMMDRYGVDALRFLMYSVGSPGEPKNFDERLVDEVVKKVRNPLINTVSFYNLYCRDLPTASSKSLEVADNDHPLDFWLRARRRQLVLDVTADLENYRITEASRRLRDFVADLSQWYLRRSRDRLRAGLGLERVRAAALFRSTLEELARLLAPLTPFLAEEVYQAVRADSSPLSVHLCDFPSAAFEADDERLIALMNEARQLVSLGLEARELAAARVRQPLARVVFRDQPGGWPSADENWRRLVAEELNVGRVDFDSKLSSAVWLDTALTPELRAAGIIRELVRQFQTERKLKRFQPGQLVAAVLTGPPEVIDLARARADELKRLVALSSLDCRLGDKLKIDLTP